MTRDVFLGAFCSEEYDEVFEKAAIEMLKASVKHLPSIIKGTAL